MSFAGAMRPAKAWITDLEAICTFVFPGLLFPMLMILFVIASCLS